MLHVKSLLKMTRLDDWKDGKCDAWDYEAVLTEHEVTVEPMEDVTHGYSLCWKHGFMNVPTYDETHARKAAALFVELWLRDVSASFADKLMGGFLFWLEATEGKRVCGTCVWWENTDFDSTRTCHCPKVGGDCLTTAGDSLVGRDEEGRNMVPGPKFGCIHHRKMAQ
jgi:hypothetical protein